MSRSPEAREALPQSHKVIHIWNHILPPSYQKLSVILGFEVRRADIIKWARFTFPESTARTYRRDIETIILETGIPRAIVLSDFPQEPVTENGRRIKHLTLNGLTTLAAKYDTKFLYIPSSKLLPPDIPHS